ncbi:hypothetical protein LIER_01886 [Lithospermum erythrorhizon]|uniref:Uncharacterized protein n=1 Tax=Lithospermum erythrorhizon TaxID=34254 RepID=A0AAV3NN98_LITER
MSLGICDQILLSSCFNSITRTPHLLTRPSLLSSIRFKRLIVQGSGGLVADESTSGNRMSVSYGGDGLRSQDETSVKSNPSTEAKLEGAETLEPIQESPVAQPQKAAKIHDFCFGIPFGGLVLGGGLVGFVFSRNLTTLSTSVIYGGALLALSTISLKVWRQGKSSLPFILGQAVLTAQLLWRNSQTYSLTKRIFPTGFYAAVSAAMLLFYSYVVLSGGNPPPKKLKQTVGSS